MKFQISRTSDWNHTKPIGVKGTFREMTYRADGSPYEERDFIEIESLDRLMDVMKEADNDLVLSHRDWSISDGYHIEIYDYYRE